jgi:predicted nucleotidyltransferase
MGNIFNNDFREFLSALNNNNVEYLLVGGYAVILHGYPRATGDMDIWVNRTKENYQKLLAAFAEFRMPIFDMTEERFLNHPEIDVFRFGRKPVAIDIMTKMADLNFEECFPLATEYNDDGLKIKVVHYNNLIQAKKAAGRYKDLNDIEQLGGE